MCYDECVSLFRITNVSIEKFIYRKDEHMFSRYRVYEAHFGICLLAVFHLHLDIVIVDAKPKSIRRQQRNSEQDQGVCMCAAGNEL